MGLAENDSNLEYLKVSTCIDYFECIFLGEEFDPDSLQWRELADCLQIDAVSFDDEVMSNSLFAEVFKFDAHIMIHTHFKKKQDKDDVDRYKLQMGGQACREFEQRGGDWLELFTFCQRQRHNVTRIDLACDDFYYLDLKELKEFIREHWYISNFRKTRREQYKGAPESDRLPALTGLLDVDDNVAPTIDGREQREGVSYSATWGTAQSCQLQIYDKYQERRHAGYDVISDHWIRFEMRFRRDRAELATAYVIDALKSGTFSRLCARLLYGCMDFKNHCWGRIDQTSNHKLETWPKYKAFIGDLGIEDKLKLKPAPQQVDIERMIAKKKRWIDRSVAKSLVLLMLDNPDKFFDSFQDSMAKKVKEGKIQQSDFAAVNYSRMARHESPFTVGEYKEFLKNNLGVEPDGDDGCSDNEYFEEDLPF